MVLITRGSYYLGSNLAFFFVNSNVSFVVHSQHHLPRSVKALLLFSEEPPPTKTKKQKLKAIQKGNVGIGIWICWWVLKQIVV